VVMVVVNNGAVCAESVGAPFTAPEYHRFL